MCIRDSGDTELTFTDSFSLSGIALGTIVVIGMYHLCRVIAPKDTDDTGTGRHHPKPTADDGTAPDRVGQLT